MYTLIKGSFCPSWAIDCRYEVWHIFDAKRGVKERCQTWHRVFLALIYSMPYLTSLFWRHVRRQKASGLHTRDQLSPFGVSAFTSAFIRKVRLSKLGYWLQTKVRQFNYFTHCVEETMSVMASFFWRNVWCQKTSKLSGSYQLPNFGGRAFCLMFYGSKNPKLDKWLRVPKLARFLTTVMASKGSYICMSATLYPTLANEPSYRWCILDLYGWRVKCRSCLGNVCLCELEMASDAVYCINEPCQVLHRLIGYIESLFCLWEPYWRHVWRQIA